MKKLECDDWVPEEFEAEPPSAKNKTPLPPRTRAMCSSLRRAFKHFTKIDVKSVRASWGAGEKFGEIFTDAIKATVKFSDGNEYEAVAFIDDWTMFLREPGAISFWAGDRVLHAMWCESDDGKQWLASMGFT